MKKIIKVKNEIYTDPNTAIKVNGQWKEAHPEPYYTNILEKIQHDIFRQHFTFGQPYCVVCLKKLKEELITNHRE